MLMGVGGHSPSGTWRSAGSSWPGRSTLPSGRVTLCGTVADTIYPAHALLVVVGACSVGSCTRIGVDDGEAY